ncbi:hypothetical protein QR680_012156 [Steinernema hermaphroditum]|uniref:Exosome complex component RRP45 n=1 Tax=Steinernema hermaphroditum TaxID=289476 RepID=A0AA39I143_9BILA|nr:hypothetical protein QR680_012156 [Steinernema hermaphroditum]
MTEPLSNAEKNFVWSSFVDNTRVDGRQCDGFREVRLWVGKDYGSALVFVGATKVLAQVSYEIVEPRSGRPNVGNIEINMNMSPMANPTFEEGRLGKKGIELTRLLELTIRESGCVDLEALCLRANSEVFQLNVDVTILNDDGALPDACSIAAVTALSHFRRPDCTVLPERTIVHSEFNKAFVPLNIFHMPICVTFGLVNERGSVVVDCTEREELCLDGALTVAINKRREVCALHQSENIVVKKHLILRCIAEAMERASNITDLITTVLNDDKKKRAKREKTMGFSCVTDMSVANAHTVHEANVLMAPGVNTETVADEMQAAMKILDKSLLETHGDTALIGGGAGEMFPEGTVPGRAMEAMSDVEDGEADESDELDIDDLEGDLDDILEATKPKSAPVASAVNSHKPPAAMIPAGNKSTPVVVLDNDDDVITIDSDDDCQEVNLKLAMKKPTKRKARK